MSDSDYRLIQESSVDGQELSTSAQWDAAPSHSEYESTDGLIDKNLIPADQPTSLSKPAPIFGPANNLVNIIVGVGVLGVPYAFFHTGLIIGVLLLILTGLGTIVSYLLLLRSARITGCNSYESISHHLFGFYFSILVKLLIILGTIASLTAYMSVVAGSLGRFIRQFIVDDSLAVFTEPKVILAFALIVIIPLSLSKRINWLTWSSYVSILPLFYLLVLEVVFFGMRTSSGENKEVDVPMAKGGIFVALPIFVFAYSSQTGAIPIFKELEEKYNAGQRHMMKISIIAVLAGFLFYSIAGIFGLLAYPASIAPNIMLSMGRSVAVDILLVAMVISVVLGYPFTVFPCRQSIDNLLFPKRQPNYLRTVIETLAIIAVSYSIASFTSFTVILGLTGGFTATITGYILPSVFYLRAQKGIKFKKDKYKVLAVILLVLGTAAGIASTTVTIVDYVKSRDQQQ